MTFRLSRGLAVEAALAEVRDRRTEDEDDLWVLWTMLFPRNSPRLPQLLPAIVEAFDGAGFEYKPEHGHYTVLPADVRTPERRFQTAEKALAFAATAGGGLILQGHDVGLGLVIDPEGWTHEQVCRTARLDDQARFGEIAIWQPAGEGLAEPAALFVEKLVRLVVERVEPLLDPLYAYAMSVDDLSTIPKIWPVHAEVAARRMPTQVFWYQYFAAAYAGQLTTADFHAAGFSEVECPAGRAFELARLPGDGLELLEVARRLWPHSVTPAGVS